MKLKFNILTYISAVLVSLMMSSCAEEILSEPGTVDNPDCYGVYFPTQSGTGDIQIDPNDPKSFTFKVRRTNTRGELTVPVTIVSEYEGVFSVSELFFEEDSPMAELKVYFPTVKKGVTYDCTLKIEGNEYISSYSQNPSFISFNVTCVEWKKLGTGKWRDGVFAEWFNLANPNLEQDVEIYEREDMPGYYRIYDVYGTTFVSNMFGMDASSVCIERNYTYINATDPEKVWIPTFKTGVVLNAEYGEMSIGSYVAENDDFDPSISSVYGTLKEGVIEFPANSIELHFALLGWYPTNSYGLHRVILPGYRAIDHTIEITAGITNDDAELPVKVKIGQDIKTLKLHAVEGSLPGSEAALIAEQIANGTLQPSIKDMVGSGEISLKFDKTGIYTLIAVGLDKNGKMAQFVTEQLGYKKNPEDEQVVVNYGLITTDKYAPEGKTSENSLELYINGKNLKRVCVALHEKEKYETYTEDCLEALNNAQLSDESLALVNGNGLSLVQTGLVPGTEYVLLVKAYNGFSEVLNTCEAKTNGAWDYRLAYYTSDDVDMDKMLNVISASDYYGTYNYYAIDYESSSRFCLGEVTISKSNATYYSTYPCVKITGLFPYIRTYYGVEDDGMDFFFDPESGALYNYQMCNDYFVFEGMYIYTDPMLYATNGAAYGGAGGLMGAHVMKNREDAKPCIAFIDSGAGAQMGVSFTGLALFGFEDASKTSFIGLLDLVDSMLLVPKDQDPDPKYKESNSDSEEEMKKAQANMLEQMSKVPSWEMVEDGNAHKANRYDQAQNRNIKNYLDNNLYL